MFNIGDRVVMANHTDDEGSSYGDAFNIPIGAKGTVIVVKSYDIGINWDSHHDNGAGPTYDDEIDGILYGNVWYVSAGCLNIIEPSQTKVFDNIINKIAVLNSKHKHKELKVRKVASKFAALKEKELVIKKLPQQQKRPEQQQVNETVWTSSPLIRIDGVVT